jgi:ketosteroid isomerase-like protein
MVTLVCVLALGVAGCSGGGAPAQEFTNEDAQQIRQMTQEFVAAYNAHDATKIANLHSGNSALMPPNSSVVRGPDSIKGYFVNRFADFNPEITLDPKDVSGHGALAYESGTFEIKLKPESGSEQRDRGKFVWIFRKLGGAWKFEYQIWSSDLPTPTPSA